MRAMIKTFLVNSHPTHVVASFNSTPYTILFSLARRNQISSKFTRQEFSAFEWKYWKLLSRCTADSAKHLVAIIIITRKIVRNCPTITAFENEKY